MNATEAFDFFSGHVGETATLTGEGTTGEEIAVDATLTHVESTGGDGASFILTVVTTTDTPAGQGTYLLGVGDTEPMAVFFVPGGRTAAGTELHATFTSAPTKEQTA